jgi:hypothetical protein
VKGREAGGVGRCVAKLSIYRAIGRLKLRASYSALSRTYLGTDTDANREDTMAKKAFCVGINDYPYDGSDLNGCVNDANAWAELLVSHYDFPRSDVTLITDAEATKGRLLAGLKS